MNPFKEFWEDVKAFRRGERRIAPYGSKGRVYERIKPESHRGNEVPTSSKGSIVTTARIIRKDGTVEDLGELHRTKDPEAIKAFEEIKGGLNHG